MEDIFTLLNHATVGSGELARRELTGEEKAEILSYIQRKQGRVIEMKKHKTIKHSAASVAAAALAATALIGGAAYAAIQWNQALEEGMQISEEQKLELEEIQLAADAGQSCTRGDVTISVDQCLVDDYFAYLSFSITGYSLEEGAEPCFGGVGVTIDGGDYQMASGSFYDGIVTDADGNAVGADGTPIEEYTPQYVQEDGTLQYTYLLMGSQKGDLIGKQIHVELDGLGTVYKAVYTPILTDTWTFDWTLAGASSAKEITLEESLGDSGATLIYAAISPISIVVHYDFPYQTHEESATDENGETATSTFMNEPPTLRGVRLKDSTMFSYLCDGGSEGYEADDLNTYYSIQALNRVIDVDEVDALLFYDANTGEAGDDLIVVPIN